MKDKRLVRIIGLVLFAALIVWTVMTLMGQPAAPDPDALGGKEAEAYTTALADYNAEIQHGYALLTLGVLVVIAFFFITEAFPIAMSAMMIPCYYSAFGIMDYKSAFTGLTDSSVILFAGMFLVGGAMFQTGLAQKIGITCVKAAGGSETKLILFIMIITGILSAFLSNTGTVACLLPVCLGIADSQGMNRPKLLMPLAMMASSGGMITMAGTPPNMSAASALALADIQMGFFDYAWAGIPIAILTIIYMMFIGNRLIPERHSDVQMADEEEGKVYSTKKQAISGIVLLVVVLVMAFFTDYITLETVAVIGGLICVFTGCLTEKEAYQSIDWTTIFLFAGALGLANAMKSTGAGALLADKVVNLLGGSPNPYVLMAVLFVLAGGLTQFMSNTAAAALLCPIGLSIAQSLGADPTGVVLAIGFSCSAAYCTPVATPPNTMVYGPGGLTFMDYVKVGVPLFLLVGIVCIIIIPIIWPFFPGA